MNSITEIRERIKDALETTEKYYDDLTKELSTVDGEITDINHYIEFVNLNAAQGYNACKLLKDRLVRRREIKNELTYINSLRQRGFTMKKFNKSNELLTRQRRYTPRVLNELFCEK